jgi:hypothetical protein
MYQKIFNGRFIESSSDHFWVINERGYVICSMDGGYEMKTECIRKSLTSDFKNVGIAIGIILGIIIGCYLIINAGAYLVNIIESIKLVMGAYEAFIIFGIISIVIGFVINLTTNKKHLVELGTVPNYMIGIAFVLSLYLVYCLQSWSQHVWDRTSYYPDVNLICILLIFANVILTPFALVYVRCKEDVVND